MSSSESVPGVRSASKPKILLIDDVPSNLQLMGEALAPDYELSFATSGPQGLVLANRNPPDVVLLDVMMPEMDGFEVCKRLKSSTRTRKIPVIFVTALAETDPELRGLRLGAADYLTKPVDVSIAKQRINNLLEREQLRKISDLQRKHLEVVVAERTAALEEARVAISRAKGAYKALQESERKFRLLAENSSDCIFWIDSDGHYRYLSPTCAELTGYGPEAYVADPELMDSLVHPDDQERYKQGIANLSSVGFSNLEFRILDRTGEEKWVEYQSRPFVDEVGAPMGRHGSIRDITERINDEEQLRIAAVAYEVHEGIVITDERQTILRVNPGFSEITGYSAEEVIGHTLEFLKSDIQNETFYQAIWEEIAREGRWEGQIWSRRKNGDVYPAWLNIAAVKNEAKQITKYVGMVLDHSARIDAERKIEHLAFHDALTELPNRRYFMDRLNEALSHKGNSRRLGALLFMDLDDFKLLNDTAGHEIGDQVLVETAQRLRSAIRQGDLVARFGADEFVVILNDLNEIPSEAACRARNIGEKIQEILGRPQINLAENYHITTSIGVTLFGDENRCVGDLIKQADIAMHQAKSAGRGSLCFFSPDMQLAVAERASVETSLHNALKARQFVLLYQPQVHETLGIVGAEALIRWQHPTRGLITPVHFISVAEETGLINEIGRWVLLTACAQLASWAKISPMRSIRLSVNVSPRQFRQIDFVDQVRTILEITGAPATRLTLELTESAVLDDFEDSTTKMRSLKGLGIALSLDDFGTGYSSLLYLSRLPVDELKIDRSFVRNLPTDSNDAVVVNAIITLARSLGLAIIAEGVENQAQRDYLGRHGCLNFQGYLIAHPMPLHDLEKMIAL